MSPLLGASETTLNFEGKQTKELEEGLMPQANTQP